MPGGDDTGDVDAAAVGQVEIHEREIEAAFRQQAFRRGMAIGLEQFRGGKDFAQHGCLPCADAFHVFEDQDRLHDVFLLFAFHVTVETR